MADGGKGRAWVGVAWRAALFLSLAALLWSFLEPRLLVVSEIEVEKKGLPPGLQEFRIAHIGDIHHGPSGSVKRLGNLVKQVNARKPDLIVITGDYGTPGHLEEVFQALSGLKAKHGVYGVLGNHDHRAGRERMEELMKGAGIVYAEGGLYRIPTADGALLLLGVPYRWVKSAKTDVVPEDFPEVREQIAKIDRDDFVVAAAHSPSASKFLPSDLVDLVLAGHTHGGQVTFFGLYAPALPTGLGQNYKWGKLQRGEMTIVVTRGVGTIFYPARFFCPPEFQIITLQGTN